MKALFILVTFPGILNGRVKDHQGKPGQKQKADEKNYEHGLTKKPGGRPPAMAWTAALDHD